MTALRAIAELASLAAFSAALLVWAHYLPSLT